MQEQTAPLVYHLKEWVLVPEDDEPERTWQDDRRALADLKADGWEISAGPAIIVDDQPNRLRREALGYVLRRSIQ